DQVQVYLEHCYDVCLVMEYVTKQPTGSRDGSHMKARLKAFRKLGLPAKFDKLGSEFQMTTDLRDHVISVNTVRNCLVHRLGVVRPEDAGNAGVIELKLRRCRSYVADTATGESKPVVFGVRYESGQMTTVFDDSVRAFSVGEHIGFEAT